MLDTQSRAISVHQPDSAQIVPAARRFERLDSCPGVIAQHGDMPHLAVVSHFGLAVIMQMPFGVLGNERARRRHMLPSTLTITAGLSSRGLGSGQPAIPRICSLNWLEEHASMV